MLFHSDHSGNERVGILIVLSSISVLTQTSRTSQMQNLALRLLTVGCVLECGRESLAKDWNYLQKGKKAVSLLFMKENRCQGGVPLKKKKFLLEIIWIKCVVQ